MSEGTVIGGVSYSNLIRDEPELGGGGGEGGGGEGGVLDEFGGRNAVAQKWRTFFARSKERESEKE